MEENREESRKIEKKWIPTWHHEYMIDYDLKFLNVIGPFSGIFWFDSGSCESMFPDFPKPWQPPAETFKQNKTAQSKLEWLLSQPNRPVLQTQNRQQQNNEKPFFYFALSKQRLAHTPSFPLQEKQQLAKTDMIKQIFDQFAVYVPLHSVQWYSL